MAVFTELIRVTNLSFRYGQREILKNISFVVREGEFIGLIGPNGSGKTTLLKLLLGLLPGAEQCVTLGGTPLANLSRKNIALQATLVPQDTKIEFAFSVRDIVAMGRTPYLGRFRPEGPADRAAIHHAMTVTETLDFAERPVTHLSGGERQRVHLARALAQETSIILLDEPTSNLDLVHQFEVLELVKKCVANHRSAIAAIHDLSMAARFCNRLLLLFDGMVVADGSPEEVLTEPNLARYFSIEARIRKDPESGSLVVWPVAPCLPL